jgi:exopolysaccharide biosynthesis protein
LQLWALRVDLGNPALEFVVNGSGEDSQAEGQRAQAPKVEAHKAATFGIIPSTTVSGFVRDYGCVAGINANPFDRVTARVGEPRTIVGIALGSGVLIAAPDPGYDALVLYRDGSAAIVGQDELDEAALADINAAVGGFFVALRDGALAERLLDQAGDGRAPRHPRSAAGLSADGKTLYLLAIDGRRAGSVGATEGELAVILQRLGADDGLNFDGGGSTALALRYPDGRIRPVNTPIHGLIPGRERAVAVCLGIRTKPGNAGGLDAGPVND